LETTINKFVLPWIPVTITLERRKINVFYDYKHNKMVWLACFNFWRKLFNRKLHH
jgi:hypothetical protein